MNVEEFSISLMNFYLHYLRSWEDGKHPPQPVSRGVPEVNPVVECRRASAFLPTHGLFSHASGWWWLEPWNFEWLSMKSWEWKIIPTDELIFFRGVGQPPTSIVSQSDIWNRLLARTLHMLQMLLLLYPCLGHTKIIQNHAHMYTWNVNVNVNFNAM
jgi:hypothetical protein